MTPHIFRKYAGFNPNSIKCWTTSEKIGTDSFDVEDIVFSRGASKAGTSIPSPLARMELFDTAFHIVADPRNNLVGRTIYHQLVSDCLDVLQLVFNAKNSDIGLGKKIWFKEWKVKENIDRLKSRGDDHPHNLLGTAFEQIFFDKVNPRYNKTDSIFLIYYENKILGGTSPLTLFFTSPNWTRFVSDGYIANIPQSKDGDVFFDNDYKPLGERDDAFVEYVYKLFLQNREAFNIAEGFRKYINRTIEIYFPNWRHEYKDYDRSNNVNESGMILPNRMDADYSKVITNVENKLLAVNGIYFYHQKEGQEKEKIKNVSDFLIRATTAKYTNQNNEEGIPIEMPPPLVLVDGMNIAGDYMEKDSPWNPNTKIKEYYYNEIPLYQRKLPYGNNLTVEYPFLTTDDFLESYLVEMPFKLNSSKFYTGHSGDNKYLLPIKKEYFNFFTIEDLKKLFSISLNEKSVDVTLKVPIRNKKGISEILFKKTYEKEKGTIVECRAGLGIYPFYKISDVQQSLRYLNDYTILLADRNEKIHFENLSFYAYSNYSSVSNQLNSSVAERSTRRDVNSGDSTATSKYFRVQEAFDFAELSYRDSFDNKCSGLIIPDFEKRTYNKDNLIKSYTFAIDFGTSNTHVAYMENGGTLPKAFEIDEADQQMVLLNAPGELKDLGDKYGFYGGFPAIGTIIRREFIPSLITSKSNLIVSYPFKTASCEIASFSNTEKSKAGLFSHINIGYYIDQEEKNADGTITSNIVYTTNLKWLLENNNDDANKSRVYFFLKQLLLQIKSKTILNNGKPNELKIVWSVPLSMGKSDRTTLKSLLKDAFKDVFGNSGAILLDPIPESIAPYFYLTRSDSGIQDTANTVNIDIGGGTTDVMMFMESAGNREDKYLTTSFRFAGGDLWGSGYKNKLKDNGFIKNYLNFQKVNNISPDENKYFTKVKDDGNLSSDDLVSLLFRYNDKFKFSDSITRGNPELSIVLYLHFAAIIYHIVEIIELKDYPLPRYISFTGKGSQYIKLICGSDEGELEEFTKLLFRSYTKKAIQGSFKLHLNENPKEITANGAVLYSLPENQEQTKKYQNVIELIHPGFNVLNNPQLSERIKSDSFTITDTLDISSELNVSVLENLNLFIEKTLKNKSITDFLTEFKVKNFKIAADQLLWNKDIFNGEGLLYDSYKKVLSDLHKQDRDNTLPESLFFYALKDSLYRLTKSIVENK